MRLHFFQHVPFEGLGSINTWATKMGHEISSTRLYAKDPFPNLDDFDWLMVMGGPMGIYDEDKYPWLFSEKNYIEKAVAQGKIVLGICLGAQLLADVLGAKVYPNKYKEIGWFPVQKTRETARTWLADFLPSKIDVFHWHGDTFDIPKGAVRIAESKACENQAFIYNDHVVALQFHLETTEQSAEALIDNCQNDIKESPFIQTPVEILSDRERFTKINLLMNELLNHLAFMSLPSHS